MQIAKWKANLRVIAPNPFDYEDHMNAECSFKQIFVPKFAETLDAFVVLAMANDGFHSLFSSDPPAPSPSDSYWNSQESPLPRKLGNHQSVAPSPSPSIAPQSGKKLHSNTKETSSA
ncbi:hypothetical protein GH714_015723 [Hevea brasiliensis]|uniref:Uncharacterized protein n=1 Tax=Hevea brasiliensis TaxID=3981 RepID=A0A6A6M094_HEVBR|nr:hypothetical protein GH714_015723 [Hevea brasiliensis]